MKINESFSATGESDWRYFYSSPMLSIAGTFEGEVALEYSPDGGDTVIQDSVFQVPSAHLVSIPASGAWLRVNVKNYTSGTIHVAMRE
jgi:hypothetical protein